MWPRPVTLSFSDPELEAAFWAHSADRRLRFARVLLPILSLLIVVFAPVDRLTYPRTHVAILVVRVALLAASVPAIPFIFGSGGAARFRRHYQDVVLYLAGVWVSAMLAVCWIAFPDASRDALYLSSANVLLVGMLIGISGLGVSRVLGVAASAFVAYFVILVFRAAHGDGAFLAFAGVFALFGACATFPYRSLVERLERLDFQREREIDDARARAERLLANIMPAAYAKRLEAGAGPVLDRMDATVVFATLAGFDDVAEARGARDAVLLLDRVIARFDELALTHGVERIKTTGATYIAAAGIPHATGDHAERAARLCLALRAEVRRLAGEEGLPLSLRAGLSSGPVMIGVIGQQRFAFDCWGDTTNTASRLDTHGEADRIQVDAGTAALLQERAGLRLDLRGVVEVKGKGALETHWLEGAP